MKELWGEATSGLETQHSMKSTDSIGQMLTVSFAQRSRSCGNVMHSVAAESLAVVSVLHRSMILKY